MPYIYIGYLYLIRCTFASDIYKFYMFLPLPRYCYPPPPRSGAGDIEMSSVRACVCACVRASVRASVPHLVCVTPPTPFFRSFWNFTWCFLIIWRCAYHFDLLIRVFLKELLPFLDLEHFVAGDLVTQVTTTCFFWKGPYHGHRALYVMIRSYILGASNVFCVSYSKLISLCRKI